jgi:hypothetical protein
MRVEQFLWTPERGWDPAVPGTLTNADLVLIFGSLSALDCAEAFEQVRHAYPVAHLFGCSTAGEIRDVEVHDGSLVVTAIAFEHTRVRGSRMPICASGESYDVGRELGTALAADDLVHVLVLSDGTRVNGSALVAGLTDHLPAGVTVTGGLSGDGDRFQETRVIWDDEAKTVMVGAVGFYGDRFQVGFGSLGGWDSFGPERIVTRSEGNVLYELDGRSALELYKEYLGEHAGGLPATGLLFPLSVRSETQDTAVVRTILSVDEDQLSMTFAGDVPEGAYARLMKANFDRLIDGASGAAETCRVALRDTGAQLALLISCVGRKLVLRQRVEEEVEGVRETLGPVPILTGFYSYGEISPFTPGARCELHNQTMTITAFAEV